jgi:uncharacterized membrane protein required for colicin V production
MLLDIIEQFNWVDIFVLILLLRICYIALKTGFNIESFKFLGTILAVYLALHYYTGLADWFKAHLSVMEEKMPLEFLDFLCFVVLAIFGYVIFWFLRETFSRFIKMEAVPRLNRWGGFIFGIGRGILLSSLVVFILLISGIGYFKASAQQSYLGSRLFQAAPSTYATIWNRLMSKFMSKEKFNNTILEVQSGLTKQ